MIDDQDARTKSRRLSTSEQGAQGLFSDKAADYAAARPDYPAALFAALLARCPADENSSVVEVGSGTGLLTQGLLQSGYRVIAVEPNSVMRTVAEKRFAGLGGFRSVPGSAESLPLENNSTPLIAAAQAFHWFDVVRARTEFLRILKEAGMVALIWNDRDLDDPLHAALDGVFTEYGGAKRGALAHEDRSGVPEFFGPTQPEQLIWPHEHRLDENRLVSLALSRSYMPGRETSMGQAAAGKVRQIFRDFHNQGSVVVRYRTVAIIGRPG